MFNTITEEEIKDGFINKELIDFEDRIRNGKATAEEQDQIDKDMAELAEIEGY